MRHLLHALGRSSLGSPNVIRVPHLQSLLTRSTIVGVRQPLHALGRSSPGFAKGQVMLEGTGGGTEPFPISFELTLKTGSQRWPQSEFPPTSEP